MGTGMRHLPLLCLLGWLAAAGCNSGGSKNGERLSGEGQSCEVTADCEEGLVCALLTCISSDQADAAAELAAGDADAGGCYPDCQPEGIKWIFIPAGTFTMGCAASDSQCAPDESPPHEVTLSAFLMLETEVTEFQFQEVMDANPSENKLGDNYPVESATWEHAKAFCEAVGGRLPTEAEWEYAARGGQAGIWSCGDDAGCLEAEAWYFPNAEGRKHAVKGRAPNGYGLHDMSGNLAEWVGDWYGGQYYSSSPKQDPQGPADGTVRQSRGGAFGDPAEALRVSNRSSVYPSHPYGPYLGFRCVTPM